MAVNPKNEKIVTEPITALVGTVSELTWLPAAEPDAIGITPRRKRTFVTASGGTAAGARLPREIGYAIVRAEGFETTDDVVLGQRRATGCRWASGHWKASPLRSTRSATDWSRRPRGHAPPEPSMP